MLNKLPTGWQQCCFEDVLDYEQPTKYIVKNTNYEDKGVAVLTAGKSFILGYTKETTGIFYGDKEPVIIFDDFTTSSKLVKFPFKVKSSAMKILHARDNINIDFIYYLMQTISYRNETHKRYWISEYAKQTLNLPPLAEQERIVEKIEELFSDIDNGIKDLKIAQAQIKQYRQSVLKSAFEGKLYKTSEWKEVKLNSISMKIGSGATPKGGKHSYYKAGIPIIRSMNVLMNHFSSIGLAYLNDEQAKQLKNVITEKDDVLLNITGASIGRTCVLPDYYVNARVNQHVAIIRTTNKIISKFLSFYLSTPYMQNKINNENYGVTRQALTKSTIENFDIPLPSLPEQQQIVAEIEKRFAVADEMEKAVNDSLLQAEKLKQSILKQAFAGKLVPQNPNDEPAAVLLERIKAAKENSTKGKK